jgi:hypothetical protein
MAQIRTPTTQSTPPEITETFTLKAAAISPAEAHDRQTPDGGRQHHRQAVAMDAGGPAWPVGHHEVFAIAACRAICAVTSSRSYET